MADEVAKIAGGSWGVRPIELPLGCDPALSAIADLNGDGFITGLDEAYYAFEGLKLHRDRYGNFARFGESEEFVERLFDSLDGADVSGQEVQIGADVIAVDSAGLLGEFELFSIKEGIRAYPESLRKKMLTGRAGEGPLEIFVGSFDEYASYMAATRLSMAAKESIVARVNGLRALIFGAVGEAGGQDIQWRLGNYHPTLNLVWCYDEGGFGLSGAEKAFGTIVHELAHHADDVAYIKDKRGDDTSMVSDFEEMGQLCRGTKDSHPICSPASDGEGGFDSQEVFARSIAFYLSHRVHRTDEEMRAISESPEIRPFFVLAEFFLERYLSERDGF